MKKIVKKILFQVDGLNFTQVEENDRIYYTFFDTLIFNNKKEIMHVIELSHECYKDFVSNLNRDVIHYNNDYKISIKNCKNYDNTIVKLLIKDVKENVYVSSKLEQYMEFFNKIINYFNGEKNNNGKKDNR
jgi:hypothetical protein